MTHLKEKLKHATDVLAMMQDLMKELKHSEDNNLICALSGRMHRQRVFISTIRNQIRLELSEGQYPNTTNA